MGNDSSLESLEFKWESHSNPAMLSKMRWISHCGSFESSRANKCDKNVRWYSDTPGFLGIKKRRYY
jgi:hypothetical protein